MIKRTMFAVQGLEVKLFLTLQLREPDRRSRRCLSDNAGTPGLQTLRNFTARGFARSRRGDVTRWKCS